MSENVIEGQFGEENAWDIPVSHVLDNLPDDLESVFVVTYNHNGEMMFATNKGDPAQVLWALEHAKRAVLNAVLE